MLTRQNPRYNCGTVFELATMVGGNGTVAVCRARSPRILVGQVRYRREDGGGDMEPKHSQSGQLRTSNTPPAAPVMRRRASE